MTATIRIGRKHRAELKRNVRASWDATVHLMEIAPETYPKIRYRCKDIPNVFYRRKG